MKKYKLFTSDAEPRDKPDFYKLYSRLMSISRTPVSESGFDEWFDGLVREGVILAVEMDDDPMELYAHLYSLMDDVEKSIWSRKHADDVLDDQRRYEIEHGLTPREYDALEFYEVIAEFIEQDANDEEF